MKPGAWIGKSWIPALHFVVGVLPCTYTINFNFSIEKLSTHIAEEQLLFQLHMEPPLLKFTDYYLTIISYQNNQGRLFVDLKWSIWPRNDFFDLER